MYLGLSGESFRARRKFLTAALMPWSKSTIVSFGQSLLFISSRVAASLLRSEAAAAPYKAAPEAERFDFQCGVLASSHSVRRSRIEHGTERRACIVGGFPSLRQSLLCWLLTLQVQISLTPRSG